MMEEMNAISHARMEMERVASANGSPRMLLARKLAMSCVKSMVVVR